MYYCPQCGKLDLQFNMQDNYKNSTVTNMRDGWGRPIKHFLCECGNPLAGVINICELGNSEEDAIKYAKELIADYNEGGLYFKRSLLDQANYIIQMKGIK